MLETVTLKIRFFQDTPNTWSVWIALCLTLVIAGGCTQLDQSLPEPKYRPAWFSQIKGINKPAKETKSISSKLAQELYLHGMNYYQQGKYKSAIDRFDAALVEGKEFIAPYMALGEVYSLTQQPYLAQVNYKRALELDPSLVEARIALGTIYMEQGKYELALEHLNAALELQPNHPKAQLTRQKLAKQYLKQGIAFRNSANWKQARMSFQAAVKADPSLGEAYLELGKVYMAQKQYQPATDNLKLAAEIMPEDAAVWKHLGKANLEIYEYDQARKDLQHSLMLQPHDEEGKKLLRLVQQELYRDKPIPIEFLEISYTAAITRGQLAAIFALNLRLPPEKSLASLDIPVVIPDISTHWAKEYIIYVVRNQLMTKYPNHYFLPEANISRGEAANILDKALQHLAGVRTLPNEAGNRLYADVPPENQYYGAINRVTALGIMSPQATGIFGVTQQLSGLEALEEVDRLADFLSRQ